MCSLDAVLGVVGVYAERAELFEDIAGGGVATHAARAVNCPGGGENAVNDVQNLGTNKTN